jgi:hypothetical protein
VRPVEAVVAGIFAIAGTRSLVYWIRRPFESTDVRDHLLFSLFVTTRAGVWLALGGIFFVYATVATVDPVTGARIPAEGRAFLDAVRAYNWLFLVPIVLATVQFVAGWFLGRRNPGG